MGIGATLQSRSTVARTLWNAASLREKPGVARVATLVALRSLPVLRGLIPKETWIRLKGTRFRVGLAQAELGTWCEVWQHRAYERFPEFVPQPGWVVIDAGANIGFFTVRAARSGAQVYSFEPNPRTYRRLRRNIAANKLQQRVQPQNMALGSSNETGWLDGDNISTVAMAVSRDKAGTVEVKICTLDSVIEPFNLPAVDLLKVDVEGAEVEVLRGAPETLKRCKRIVMEYHSDALGEQVSEILMKAHFSVVFSANGYGYYLRNT